MMFACSRCGAPTDIDHQWIETTQVVSFGHYWIRTKVLSDLYVATGRRVCSKNCCDALMRIECISSLPVGNEREAYWKYDMLYEQQWLDASSVMRAWLFLGYPARLGVAIIPFFLRRFRLIHWFPWLADKWIRWRTRRLYVGRDMTTWPFVCAYCHAPTKQAPYVWLGKSWPSCCVRIECVDNWKGQEVE